MQRLPPRPRTLTEVIDRLDKLDSESLAVQEQLGRLAAEIGSLREATPIRSAEPIRPEPIRSPEASYHDFDEQVAKFRENLRVTARRDSLRARQIAVEAVKSAERDGKAASWDKLVQTAWRIAVGIAVGVLVTAVVYHFGLR
jgi:hypothetical protein